jgi:hypothetical protein
MLLNAAIGLVLLSAALLTARAAEVGVVLVVDRVGAVAMAGTAAPRAIATLAALPLGTRIRLEPGARITLLFVSTGDEYTVAGPGEALIDAAGVSTSDGATAQRRAAGTTRPIQLRSDAIAMGGVVMRSAGLRARHPAGLLTAPPTRIAWESLAVNARYRVELRDAAGTLLFSQSAQGTSLPFPDSVALQADERYTWSVALEGAAAPAPSAGASFSLAPEAVRAESRQFAPPGTAAFSDRVVYGLWLEQIGATGEARQLWQRLLEERPDDDALSARARR